MSRVKILLGLTEDLLKKLDIVSLKLGLTRTAYIITILQQSVSKDLKKLTVQQERDHE